VGGTESITRGMKRSSGHELVERSAWFWLWMFVRSCGRAVYVAARWTVVASGLAVRWVFVRSVRPWLQSRRVCSESEKSERSESVWSGSAGPAEFADTPRVTTVQVEVVYCGRCDRVATCELTSSAGTTVSLCAVHEEAWRRAGFADR